MFPKACKCLLLILSLALHTNYTYYTHDKSTAVQNKLDHHWRRHPTNHNLTDIIMQSSPLLRKKKQRKFILQVIQELNQNTIISNNTSQATFTTFKIVITFTIFSTFMIFTTYTKWQDIPPSFAVAVRFSRSFRQTNKRSLTSHTTNKQITN